MGDSPAIEKNILLGHFLHSESRRVPLEDGVGYVPWETLDESIGELFRLCFDRGHDNQIVRPATEMWETAITQATTSLAGCPRSPQHLYFRHNRSCPWCERTRVLGGDDPFPSRSGPPPLIVRRGTVKDRRTSPERHLQAHSGDDQESTNQPSHTDVESEEGYSWPLELAENPEPRWPCVLLLDTSGAMYGPPCRELNDRIRALAEEFENDILASLRLDIAIVSFNNSVELLQDFASVDALDIPEFTARGTTRTASAINYAINILESRKATYQGGGITV